MNTIAESLKVWDRLISEAAHGRQPVTEQMEIDFSGPATKWLEAQTEALKKIRGSE